MFGEKISNILELKMLVFVVIVFGLSKHFGNCMLEYSGTYSVTEIGFEMEVFRVFEELVFTECQSNKDDTYLSKREKQWKDTKKSISKSRELTEIDVSGLKSEIMCVEKISKLIMLSTDFDPGKMVQLSAVSMVHFLSAKYAAIFARGYIYYKDAKNLANAKNCAYLAEYLGAFVVIPQGITKLFAAILEPIMKKMEEDNKFSKMINEYPQVVSAVKKMIFGKDATIRKVQIPETDKYPEIDRTILTEINLFFAYALFGYTADVVLNITGKTEVFVQYDEPIDEQRIWNLAEKIYLQISKGELCFFPRLCNGKRNKSKNRSKLVDILRELEIQKARYHYLDYMNPKLEQKLEKLKLGFHDDSNNLELFVITDENKNLSLRFMRKYQGKLFFSNNKEFELNLP